MAVLHRLYDAGALHDHRRCFGESRILNLKLFLPNTSSACTLGSPVEQPAWQMGWSRIGEGFRQQNPRRASTHRLRDSTGA